MRGKPLSISPAKLNKVLEYIKVWEYTEEELEIDPYFRPLFVAEICLFSVCRRQAYLGWNTSLNSLLKKLRATYKDNFHMGKDSLFFKDEGWYFKNYHSNKILLRLTRLHSSGIPKFWSQFLHKPVSSEYFCPKKLELNSHLMTIFFLLCGGCLLGGFSFLLEIGCNWINMHAHYAIFKCQRLLILICRVVKRGLKI